MLKENEKKGEIDEKGEEETIKIRNKGNKNKVGEKICKVSPKEGNEEEKEMKRGKQKNIGKVTQK